MQMQLKSDRSSTLAKDERRTLHRLRALCDEVLASYRASKGITLVSDRERMEAQLVLARVAPMRRR